MPRRKDWAMIAAKNIWDDCLDRQGIKFAFREVDCRVKWDEMLPEWAKIIREAESARTKGANNAD